ncbi:MAG: ribosome recycling factor [Cytophagales bacterium]|nr:ribosome recycling factor [Armatimonadota bacterium]
MSVSDVLKEMEGRFKKSIESARADFATLRTGRANPAILDGVRAEYYGQQMPLSQLATIAVPEARQLLITPYDKATMALIEKAIIKSDLGLTPNNDGQAIRINIPQLTEERRKEFVKQLHQKAEGARVSLRNIRRDANEQFKRDEAVTDDEAKRAEKDVQKLLDRYILELDTLQKSKEAELLEV